jgi:rod shape-determining protein MreD
VRNLAFLAGGLALLVVQANLFRVLEGLSLAVTVLLWFVAAVADVSRGLRGSLGHPRAITTFRADLTLPATVLVGYVALVAVGHVHASRPIPALVLPIILFMGVHEYSLARGAAVAFVLGYATDLLGIAPVGLYTFTYVATFVLARAAGVRLAAQTTWMQVLLVGAFSILQSTMLLVLLAIFGRDVWVPRSLYPLALPHAIATAAVAPLIFRMAEALDGAAGGKLRAEGGAGAGAAS